MKHALRAMSGSGVIYDLRVPRDLARGTNGTDLGFDCPLLQLHAEHLSNTLLGVVRSLTDNPPHHSVTQSPLLYLQLSAGCFKFSRL